MKKRDHAICELCGSSHEHLHICKMCGSYVCDDCFNNDDLCLSCVEAKCQICGDFLSSRACDRCGRLVCEDHGVRINAATLCDECRTEKQ